MADNQPIDELQPEVEVKPATRQRIVITPGVPDTPPPQPAKPRRRRIDPRGILVAVLLLAVLGVGAYFRFVGQNWDDFTHLHPDERFLTGVVSSISPVSGIGEYFNTHESSLNPNNRGAGFYVYGTLPLFIVKAASGIVADITQDISWTGYNGAHLVGRNVSAIADLLSLFFIFLIGRRLYSRWVGLLAAALYAGAVLPVQLSHFWTMDASSNLPVVIAFWFAVRALDDGGWKNYIGFGIAFGAAVASRINVFPLAIVAVIAAGIRLRPAFDAFTTPMKRQRLLTKEGGGLVLGGLVSIIVFRLAQPYAFDGPSIFGILPNLSWWSQMTEVRRQVSGQVDFPPNHQWASRIPYLFSWQNIVLWGMGLPLGLTAWLGWAWAGLQTLRGRVQWGRHLLPVTWILLYFGWQGGGWVMSMRYYMPIYPFLIILAAWALVELVKHAAGASSGRVWRLAGSSLLLAAVTAFTLLWALGFTSIYTRQLTRVQASHWFLQNVPADYSFFVQGSDGESRFVNIGLANDSVTNDDKLLTSATRYFENGAERSARFTAPITGEVDSIHAAYLGDPLQDVADETLWVGLVDATDGRLVGQGVLTANFSQGDSVLGQPYDIALDEPAALDAGHTYELKTRAQAGAPIMVAGTVIATEGPWDDPVPNKVCQMPEGQLWTPGTPPGLATLRDCVGIDGFGMGYYQGLEMFMAAEDNQQKRDTMQQVLDSTDYLTISSNRFYDTLSRLPMRFPMSLRYYDLLFKGELGFELVQTFDSTFTFGSLKVSDQVLPTYDVPAWLNEFEAEEAFHVYDHPAVFVFRKTEDYDSAFVAQLLNGVEITSSSDVSVWADGSRTVGVVQWAAPQASKARTALMLPDSQREAQFAGGTWSEMFNVAALINRSQVVGVIAWWGLLIVFGLIIWPTLFAVLPALPDRAYPVAKIAGLLVVSWMAWFGASVGVRSWSPQGILVAMGAVLALSVFFAVRKRKELSEYCRANWRRLLVIEAISVGMFLVFLGVRLGNPDLWHPNFGGEKPMDFAYLNAVLRSTSFPPLNPWYSGGYINYYYYGFVLVGTPIKLLGIEPSVAFNLLLATLFSLTGMGAFSAAYNLVASMRNGRKEAIRLANPWLAGAVAMLLAVVLGNLDEIRQLVTGLARTGGWRPVTGEEFLPPLTSIFAGISALFSGQPLNFSTHWWYWNPTRVIVHTGNAITEIPFFSFLYGDPHAHNIAMPLTLLAIVWAIHEILVAVRSQRRSGFATFVSIALGALTVGILKATNFADWVTYTVLGVFALTVGAVLWHQAQRDEVADERMPDPSFGWRLFGLVGGAGLYLGWHAFKRLHLTWASIMRWLVHVLGFVALSALFVAPFTYWYATADAIPKLWEGQKTPLWGYLDIHGLFLFLVISLLAWETVNWLRAVRVERLVGRGAMVRMVLIGLAWLVFLAVAATLLGYMIAIVALPIIFWAAILFFRPGQPVEKRIVMAFIVLAISLTFVVDVIVWAGDIARQNTVFKFYVQIWLLLSVVGGTAFAWLHRASDRWRAALRVPWMAVVTVLFTIAAMYPLLASQAKFIDRMASDAPRSLDGMAFMPYATQGEHGEWFSLEEDYDMIRWMQQNIEGSPIVLEGQSEREYLWGSRVSVYTGLPTLVGYNFHQRQQRTLDPLSRIVQQRVLNVNTIYDTPDIDIAWRLLREFDVSYIVVGQLERAYYTPEGLEKFDRMVERGQLDVVYREGATRVYALREIAVIG